VRAAAPQADRGDVPHPFTEERRIMSKDIVRHAPGAILSRAVEYNGMVFLAGLTADDQKVGIEKQTEQILRKIDEFLAAAGSNKSRVLSALVYVADIREKDDMNKAWQAWMDKANPPARACVEARLGSPATRVEIMVTAAK